MRTTGLIAFALVLALAVAAAGSASANLDSLPTHLAGSPTTDRLLIALRPRANTTWNVYSDGRVIWQKWNSSGDATVVPAGERRLDTGYVQQRLTPQGVQLLQSKLLATGLFEHNLRLAAVSNGAWVYHQVRRGDRLVTVSTVSRADPSWEEATPAQTRALASIENLVANPASWLPASAWADPRVQAFVPARIFVVLDRGYPDISKLPAPAGKVLAQYKQLKRHACQIVTTGQARALVQAFVKAGIAPSNNHGWNIAFDFAGLHLPHPSFLHLHPALPSDHC
jgi:hypothetical protein